VRGEVVGDLMLADGERLLDAIIVRESEGFCDVNGGHRFLEMVDVDAARGA
jgi:hypothetical protein